VKRLGSAVLALLGFAVVAAPGRAADPDLVFPDGEKGARLRIEVTDGGKSPEVLWAAFLDKLFTHFDRDGDGALSPAEVKRVFPLPVPDGREVAPDFTAMDANGDGKVTQAEFRTFYRAKGFTPVGVVVQPAPEEALKLGEALFRHLDRDHDGKLSAEELRRAPALLKRLDEDEDEVLTAKELLGTDSNGTGLKPAGVKLITDGTNPDATLQITLGGKPTLVPGKSVLGLVADGAHLHVPGGVCTMVITRDDPAAGFRAAKSFYLAQFKAAAGDKPAPKSLFEDDPTAQVLAGLFDAADRDGDGKLTRAELEAFFDLIELGISCRVIVTVTDRGRNLFDLFDTDADGRLDLGELLRASRTLPNELARDKPLAGGAVPASYRLVVGRGPVGDSFGPVPFGAVAKPKPPAARARGPAWFRAMDKNGDGFVSAQEFIGPPELFARLDTNGDGRISVEEAEAAEAAKAAKP
jgi:Ca2+-binding EF-hand superfamily protein